MGESKQKNPEATRSQVSLSRSLQHLSSFVGLIYVAAHLNGIIRRVTEE